MNNGVKITAPFNLLLPFSSETQAKVVDTE